MKKFNIFLLLFILFSCQNNKNTLYIEGTIDNLTSPYIISVYRNADSIFVDSILVDTKGKFKFSQKIDTTTTITLYFNNLKSAVTLFSEKEVNKIRIKGDALLSDLIEVRGGEINDDITHFKKENETLLKQRSNLLSKLLELDDSIKNNSDNVISEKERVAQLNIINHELSQNVEKYISENSNKISSVILINEFFKNNENIQSLNRVLEYLEGDVLNYSLTQKLKSYSEKINLSAEGSHMPFLKLKDIDDKPIQSSDFKDKYLLLSFLSYNGSKSDENIRIMKEEYKQLNEDNINFLSIFIDTDSLSFDEIKTDSIPWRVVIEDKSWGSDIVANYNIHYTPFNILINPKGKIITRDIPLSEIKQSINTTKE